MNRRVLVLATSWVMLLGASASGVAAAGPVRESDRYTVRFADDFIRDLCGIETWTTLTERWTFKEFADGTQTLQLVRTFVPDDLRIPIEKGAGVGITRPDGSFTVVGKPIQLIRQDGGGGVTFIEAGRAAFGPDEEPGLDADLAELYCP